MATDAAMPLFDHPAPHVELNSTVAEEDKPRLSAQHHAIADALRDGPKTNLQLSMIALRFGARLQELRKAGLGVKTERIKGSNGVVRYTLIRDFLQPGEQTCS